MVETFQLGGEKYKMTGNPTLGTVRKVQSMQTDLLLDYLDEEKLKEMESLDNESQIIQAIIDEGGVEAFEEVQWKRSMLEPIQTISLAADHPFNADEFEKMPATEYKDNKSQAEDALGGTATDFFKELGIGSSLSEEEMNRMQ